MIFARVFVVFLLLAVCAVAQDQPSTSKSAPSAISSEPAPNGSGVPKQQPFWMYRAEPVIATFHSNAPDRIPSPGLRGRSLADLNGNVCYTMRMYKIKATERIREGETVDRGYSECEVASNFQIHSAEAHQKIPPKVK